MNCLDTNIIIDFWRGDLDIISRMDEIKSEPLFITPVTLCELYCGACLSSLQEKNLNLIRELLLRMEVADFTAEACEIFGMEYAKARKIRKLRHEPDLMIASIAKAHGLTMVTRNRKHFENMDIRVDVW